MKRYICNNCFDALGYYEALTVGVLGPRDCEECGARIPNGEVVVVRGEVELFPNLNAWLMLVMLVMLGAAFTRAGLARKA